MLKNPDVSYEYTYEWNLVVIASDESRVLGLGDIGPEVALPVMGKSTVI